MSNVATWPASAETWLDERGKLAWIGATVIGFVVFWPVGLAMLGYLVFFKKKNGQACGPRRMRSARAAFKSSGNQAFDSYKGETLRRLEEEQKAFEDFLQRLREAKDKSEFDAFMDDRATRARAATASDEGTDDQHEPRREDRRDDDRGDGPITI